MSILQEIGLTINEEKVFGALLKLKRASISAISAESMVHTKNAYDALSRLQQKGLVSVVPEHRRKIFIAEDPERLKDYFLEKGKRLESILPGLLSKYKGSDDKKNVTIHYGIEALKKRTEDCLKGKEKIVRVFAPTELGFLETPRFKYHVLQLRVQLKETGKTLRLLERDSTLCKKRARIFDKGSKIVFRRFMRTDSPQQMNWTVSGDIFSICFFDEEMLYIRIQSKTVAACFQEIFDGLWKIARER